MSVEIADPVVQGAADLLRCCERELETESDPLRVARLHYEIAMLHETALHDLVTAAHHYAEALRGAPEHRPTIRGARRVYLASGSYHESLGLFDAEARIASSPKEKAELLYEKGGVYEDYLADLDGAGNAYAAALELDSNNPSILKAIERCHAARGNKLGQATTAHQLPNAIESDPRHRAALIVNRARHLRPNERDAAAELYETALSIDPTAVGALEALKRIYHASGRLTELAGVLEREAQQASDSSIRASALYQLGRLHSDKGNRAEAISALARAADAAPSDRLILEDLGRLYEDAEDYDALVVVLRALVSLASDPAERAALLHRLGQLLETHLDNAEEAIDCFRIALDDDPTYIPALQALGTLYARRDEWLALIEMHLAEAESSQDATRRAAAHARIAEIFEVRLKRPVDAAEHHARALSLVPGYPASFKALSRLYRQAGLFRELIELYERAIDDAPGAAYQVTYLFKIGALWEDSLGDPVQAAHAYRRILKLEPNRLGAIHSLQRVTERGGRYKELVEAIELEAQHTSDKAQIVGLLHRAGTVLDEQLGDRDAALARFRRALDRDPRFVPALASLGRIYYRAGRWEDLLAMYERELAVTDKGPAAIALLHRMGELCEKRLGREDDAIKHYRRAAEMNPSYTPALRALARKLEDRGDWTLLPEVYELEVAGLDDPSARAAVLYRLGTVYEAHLSNARKAIAAYEQALAAVADYRPAIDALTRLRTESKTWPQLVEDLERDERATSDPARVAAALMRQAEIWRDQLGDDDRAIADFEQLLDTDHGYLAALLALEPLYASRQAWDALAMAYDRQADTLSDPDARVAALRELARVQAAHGVGEAADLVQTYERILAIAPDDQLALSGLEAIATANNNRVVSSRIQARLGSTALDPAVSSFYFTRLGQTMELVDKELAAKAYRGALAKDRENLSALRGLARLAEQSGDAQTLADLLRSEADLLRTPAAAATSLVRAAELRMANLGDNAGAIADLQRALEVSPDDESAATMLLDVMLAENHVEHLVDVLSTAASAADDPSRVAALWMDVARLYAHQLDNAGAAIATLARALKSDPDNVEILGQLAELYVSDRQWNEALTKLERVLSLADDSTVVCATHLAIAAIADEHQGDPERALQGVNRVLSIVPEHTGALERLIAIHMRADNTDGAVDVARRLVSAATDAPDRARALEKLAEIEHARGDEEATFGALCEAVLYEGPSGRAAKALQKLMHDQAGWKRYADALSAHIHQGDMTDPATAYRELAAIQADKLGVLGSALATLERGVAATDADPTLLLELTTRLTQDGQIDQALAQIHRVLHHDITKADTWRSLAATLDRAGRIVEARRALAPLVVLGAASEAEREAVGAMRRSRCRPDSLGPAVLRGIAADNALASPAAPLLAALAPAMNKLHPGELDRHGLSKRDRIGTKSINVLRSIADEVAEVFGVKDFELYEQMLPDPLIAIETTDPPAVILSERAGELPESKQVFLLAFALTSIAAGFYAIEKIDADEVEKLLAGAARTVSPSYGMGIADDDELDEYAQRVKKATPRKHRKAKEDAALLYASAPASSIEPWVDALRQTAVRVAMLLSDDLPGTVQLMKKLDPDLGALSGPELVRASPVIRDLLHFWVSDQAHAARRAIGMVPMATAAAL